MDWTQVLTVFAVIATNLGTIIALYCQLDRKMEDHRKETNQTNETIRQEMKESRQETNQIIEAIRQDIKDFHGRLCAVEERNKGK